MNEQLTNSPRPYKGFFLSLEGIDGAGKTSMRQWMYDWFVTHRVTPIMTREPGGTPTAELIREIILTDRPSYDELTPMAETLLFMAARHQHLDKLVLPQLNQGQVVITDRFCDSTFCYQGAGRGLDVALLQSLHKQALDDVRPDLTIVLDGDPEVFRKRLEARGDMNRLDNTSLKFQQDSRALFLEFAAAEPERYAVVNAELSFDQVTAQLIPHLMTVLNAVWSRPSL